MQLVRLAWSQRALVDSKLSRLAWLGEESKMKLDEFDESGSAEKADGSILVFHDVQTRQSKLGLIQYQWMI